MAAGAEIIYSSQQMPDNGGNIPQSGEDSAVIVVFVNLTNLMPSISVAFIKYYRTKSQ